MIHSFILPPKSLRSVQFNLENIYFLIKSHLFDQKYSKKVIETSLQFKITVYEMATMNFLPHSSSLPYHMIL